MNCELNEKTLQLYDRQIRLWGLGVQEKLCSSHVLLIGLTALNIEASKNIILSGANITICAGMPRDERDEVYSAHAQMNCLFSKRNQNTELPEYNATESQLFLSSLSQLNSFCSVRLISYDAWLNMFNTASSTDASLEDYKALVVDMWSLPKDQVEFLDEWCHSHQKGFFLSQSLGIHGAIFHDLGIYSKTQPPDQRIVSTVTYPSLKEVLNVPFHHLPSGYTSKRNQRPHEKLIAYFVFLRDKNERLEDILKDVGYKNPSQLSSIQWFKEIQQYINYPFPPTAAIVGGVLANEVQLYISGEKLDFHNIFLFDGNTCEGLVFSVAIKISEHSVSLDMPVEESIL